MSPLLSPCPQFLRWVLRWPAFHRAGDGFREVRSVAGDHTASKGCPPLCLMVGPLPLYLLALWACLRTGRVSLVELQSLVPAQTCPKQNLRFIHVPRWVVYVLKFEKHCPIRQGSKLEFFMSCFYGQIFHLNLLPILSISIYLLKKKT